MNRAYYKWLVFFISMIFFYTTVAAQSNQSLVRGYVAFKVWDRDKSSQDIFIPGVQVYLKNLLDGSTGQPVLTDLSGRFTLSGKWDMRYQVCWKGKDFISSCQDSTLSISKENQHIGNVYIQPQQRKTVATSVLSTIRQPSVVQPTNDQPSLRQPIDTSSRLIELPEGLVLRPDFVLPPGFVLPQPSGRNYTSIYGQVRNNDGDIPRFLEPMANVNYFTEVVLLDQNDQELNRVAVNNFGDYLLPKVPTKQKITLMLVSENWQDKLEILKEANLQGSALHAINLQLRNSAPEIKPLIAKDTSGNTVRQVLPGDKLVIKANIKDKDGDNVKVRWMTLGGSGEIDDPSSDSITWKLPNAEGAYRIQMVAYDGKGGYNRSTVSVKANREGLVFSGRVVDNQDNAIDKAVIEINGEQFFSKTDGSFYSMVKNSDRFVLNIRKKGYGLVSKIYDNSITGGKWVMTRATTFNNLDPSNDIEVVNTREYPDCPGPEFLRLNWKSYPGLDQPVIQDGKGNITSIGEPGVRFESLPLRKRYLYKDRFSDSGVTMQVGGFKFTNGETTKKGYLRVDSKNLSGGTGKDIQIGNATVNYKFKKPIRKLTLQFGEYGGNVNLKINGKLKNVNALRSLDGTSIEGVKVKVKMDNNDRTGQLILTGRIKNLAIGGQEFWLDDVIEPMIPQIKVNRECGPGIQLKIPANSLVDANGNPPAGKVNIDLNTIDLMSPRQMPGDYTVDVGGGNTGVMRSFGAGTVEIYDNNNNEFNLKPGSSAGLTIPVDQAQLAAGANLPNQIPLLYYDEQKGIWQQDGVGQLQGNNYVAQVSHFSTINMDLIKTDQSCIRIYSPTLPATYTLEIMLADPDDPNAAPILKSANISNGPPSEHVIYNLPSNENIVLIPIRDSDSTPIGHFIVNSGGPQNPTNPNRPAGPPYDACSTEVTLFERAIPDQPTSGEFLHGLTTFAATNLDELDPADPSQNALLISLQDATANYYSNIDPRKKRTTLADFKTTNSFDATETRLSYANGGDLGFGRDMHCMKTNVDDDGDGIEEADEFDIACYVTNYGDITSDDATDAQDAQLAGLGGGSDPIATVAMEYSRIESLPGEPIEFDDPDRVVKFFVYKGGDATPPAVAIDQDGNADGVLDQLLQNAALDSPLSSAPGDVDFRPRPIPQLCMVCHGGEYPGGPVTSGGPPFNSRDEVKLGSRFIPFDSTFYAFPPAPFDEADPAVQLALKAMNEEYVLATNPGGPIERVIANLYTGVDPDVQDEVDTISGWDSATINRDMYHDVVSDTCRMCHASIAFPDLDFDTSAGFINKLGQAENRVCSQHVMPHAKVTHDIFWSSTGPNMAAMFQVYGDTFGAASGWNGQLCGDFTPGGDTPVSDFDSIIQPIFDNHCTGCHVGASPSGGLDLSLGNSYGNLVGVSSLQLPAMPRITANDINNSYLYLKITNAHSAAGGSGDYMPPPYTASGDPLSIDDPAAVQAILDWINNGAPN